MFKRSNAKKFITKRATAIAAASLTAVAALAIAIVALPQPADAQTDSRTVTGLRLGHNTAWHLVIEWDEPGHGIPKDYRVMWAKSSESYKTWRDESGNAFPNTNRHVVMDAERGVEYKVKVRARYHDGSGPWSDEARYTVPAPPEPTPAPTATPEPTPEPADSPHWESSDMPEYVAMFDWSDVDNAIGYELEMHIGAQPDDWEDIADPSGSHGYRAYMHGSSAIIGSLDNHERTVRVRAVFADDTTTDWYAFTIRPE